MSIRKKGSRHIVVDEIKYRWVVKYNGCIHRTSVCCPEWNTLLIEQVGITHGQILKATFDMHRRFLKAIKGEGDFAQQLSVTPFIVRQVIQLARNKYQWQPTQKLPILILPDIEEQIDISKGIDYNGLEDYQAKIRQSRRN